MKKKYVITGLIVFTFLILLIAPAVSNSTPYILKPQKIALTIRSNGTVVFREQYASNTLEAIDNWYHTTLHASSSRMKIIFSNKWYNYTKNLKYRGTIAPYMVIKGKTAYFGRMHLTMKYPWLYTYRSGNVSAALTITGYPVPYTTYTLSPSNTLMGQKTNVEYFKISTGTALIESPFNCSYVCVVKIRETNGTQTFADYLIPVHPVLRPISFTADGITQYYDGETIASKVTTLQSTVLTDVSDFVTLYFPINTTFVMSNETCYLDARDNLMICGKSDEYVFYMPAGNKLESVGFYRSK